MNARAFYKRFRKFPTVSHGRIYLNLPNATMADANDLVKLQRISSLVKDVALSRYDSGINVLIKVDFIDLRNRQRIDYWEIVKAICKCAKLSNSKVICVY